MINNKVNTAGCVGCHYARHAHQTPDPEAEQRIRLIGVVFGLGLIGLIGLVLIMTEAAFSNLESLLLVSGLFTGPLFALTVRKNGDQTTQPAMEFED